MLHATLPWDSPDSEVGTTWDKSREWYYRNRDLCVYCRAHIKDGAKTCQAAGQVAGDGREPGRPGRLPGHRASRRCVETGGRVGKAFEMTEYAHPDQLDGDGRLIRLRKRTDQEMVESLLFLFEQATDREPTEEEIDEMLRAFGYDPDEIGQRFQAIAEKALAEQRAKLGLDND